MADPTPTQTREQEARDIANAKLSAADTGAGLVQEGLWDYCFLMHPANSYRAFDTITLPQSATVWLPGDFLQANGAKATAPGNIAGINCQFRNTSTGARMTNAVTRDCEVADAYLQYGEMDVPQVNARLATLGIIVRQAVLPNTMPATFDPWGQPSGGEINSGVPPATQAAAWTPDTLEAAEPDKKADDHGRVNPDHIAAEKERLDQQRAAHPQPPRPSGPGGNPTGGGGSPSGSDTGSGPHHRGRRE